MNRLKYHLNLIEAELNDTDYNIFAIFSSFLTSLDADDPITLEGLLDLSKIVEEKRENELKSMSNLHTLLRLF